MPTISDVAALAGVSTATVSRALNGKSTVDPTLVERVASAARQLDYRPNGLARNLRKRATAVLNLIISDVRNPFFTAIARGAEDVAQAAGYSVVLCNSDENASKERRYVDVALSERAAGVIISPTGTPANFAALQENQVPIVAVDRPAPGPLTDMVLVDSRLAARQATEHLIAQGYARIACITGPAGIRTTDDRLAGYRDALHADKQRSTASLVKNAEYHAAGAKAATHALYANKDRPDAILVANNAIAVGTLECLQELGLRPGRDVGVVAFDEAPWTTLIDPPLSVVAQPAHEIGMLAARMLLARIDDPARPPATTTLNARLVERASSQRIR